MDISSLSPEQQEEMRRVFPEEFAESTPFLATSYSVNEEATPTMQEENAVEDVSFEEVENILEEVITIEEFIETPAIYTPSIDVAALVEEVDEILDTPIISETKSKPVKVQYSRFKGADWFEIVQEQEIILAGLGGIGSYVNFALSRLGPRALYLFDDDRFESHNMSGQFVSKNDINKFKV